MITWFGFAVLQWMRCRNRNALPGKVGKPMRTSKIHGIGSKTPLQFRYQGIRHFLLQFARFAAKSLEQHTTYVIRC